MLQRHGSGKTAVLVERIINKIVNEKIDIDKILVVTFTNAAAAEMRQRILDAIYKRIEENPEDIHMQRQTVLMAKSNICTIHSFCLEVIKNNFYEIDASPNFRIGDQAEIELLKQEVLEDIFEVKYLKEDKEFLQLINTYTGYRGDEPLKEIILKIYRYIQSSPFPEEWLNNAVEEFNLKDKIDEDFANTKWGKILLQSFYDEIYSCIIELRSVKKDLSKYYELEKYSKTIDSDIEKLEKIESNLESWDKVYNLVSDFKFDKWPIDKKITLEQKEISKEKRDTIKKKFNKIRDKILIYNSHQANEDIYQMYNILKSLKNIVIEFEEEFTKKKKEKNIIDFNDIEHFALKILVAKNKEGKYIATEVAKKYRERFNEIAIDEYQDSNLVQEYILSTVSNGNNIFMVGDVKQSIYKFRQARPELFIEKYDNYKLKKDKQEQDNLKIQLFKNFRSRKNILDITNLVFENIMSKKLGDITYNENEYLNLGANYEELSKNINYAGKTELNIIDLKQKEDETDENERVEDMVLEAKFVANRIQDLINSKYQVYDKRFGYRDIQYKDIVILLRSTQSLAPIYEKEISSLGLPVFSDTGTQYLDSVEIQTIMSLLKIIDNPMQDIPLVTVLRSPIGGLDDNDLVNIKLHSKESNKSFYEVILEAKDNIEKNIKTKLDKFLNNIDEWRKKQEYASLDELIWQIYLDTGYYNYVSLMPNGILRQANLKMLFDKARQYETASFKGLFNFINFIDKLKTNNGDMDSAKLIGENEDVIRIMSIHKSKGLEFPVVILSATGKQINMQDLNDNILLHQDIGLGPKHINYDRKIEYNTLAKAAISYKSKDETISEEMRVLYVALTRAKEKLIITGLSKDVQKELNKKQELLSMYEENNINSNIVKRYKSYRDWLELVYLKNRNKINEILQLNIIEKENLIKELNKEEIKKEKIDLITQIEKQIKNEEQADNKLEQLLGWKYENILASKIPTKTSVTKIKEMQQSATKIILEDIKYEKETNMAQPKFLNEDVHISNAKKGTLIHLCIQRLDEKIDYNYDKIKNMINKLVQDEIITVKEAESIDINKLVEYTKSDLWKELKRAKEIHKEQPFYISISAKEIYNEDVQEDILVQGVIDLYYIDEQNNVVLVDYKTDYVQPGKENELINKYYKQLELYKNALENSLNTKVSETYIYSVYLQKSIKLDSIS